jgi:hypothetical protein
MGFASATAPSATSNTVAVTAFIALTSLLYARDNRRKWAVFRVVHHIYVKRRIAGGLVIAGVSLSAGSIAEQVTVSRASSPGSGEDVWPSLV